MLPAWGVAWRVGVGVTVERRESKWRRVKLLSLVFGMF